MSQVAQVDLELYIGMSITDEITFYDEDDNPIDFAGFSGVAEIRVKHGDPLILRLDSASDEIVFDDNTMPAPATPTGRVRLNGAFADTAAITAGSYQWDLILTDPDGRRDVWAAGSVSFQPTITVP